MPRRKGIRTVITDIVMYVGLFFIVGHLCENLCERFMMQSELANMKSELNTLETCLSNIEMAYDTLREDIKHIVLTAKGDIKPAYETYIVSNPTKTNIRGIFNKLVDAESCIAPNTRDFMQNYEKGKKDFMQLCTIAAEDKSTVTEGRAIKYVDTGSDIGYLDDKDICKCVEKFIRDNEIETKNHFYSEQIRKMNGTSLPKTTKSSGHAQQIKALEHKVIQ